ncbi:MAG: MBL fold metallo-hydrolase [bacterium]|nr:MBL fold metallo-hydrolase [bacterium]
MLIRTTGEVSQNIHLITIGSSCTYVAGNAALTLFDSCLSGQVELYIKKLAALGLSLDSVSSIFITHLHADRIGGIPLIRKINPKINLITSQAIESELIKPEVMEKIFKDNQTLNATIASTKNDLMSLAEFTSLFSVSAIVRADDTVSIGDGITVRIIAAPGHTKESLCYLIQPQQLLIVDEGFGYFKMRGFTAPGAEYSLESNNSTLSKILSLDIKGLCLPSAGVITGSLVRKHINNLISNTAGMLDECVEAFKIGMTEEEVKLGVINSFYTDDSKDPLFTYNLDQTFQKIWPQIKAFIQSKN